MWVVKKFATDLGGPVRAPVLVIDVEGTGTVVLGYMYLVGDEGIAPGWGRKRGSVPDAPVVANNERGGAPDHALVEAVGMLDFVGTVAMCCGCDMGAEPL